LFEGNHRIDTLVSPATVVVPHVHQQARLSHSFYHQSAKALAKQFKITLNQARNIIAACPHCAPLPASLPHGVNPRGLKALELWQTDITFFKSFKNLQHIHVTVDTFSHMIWATAQ
ncbi:POK8 protein, partial [Thalassarche chlororhynchos]|nr:POK8 protein [Thalassarche chlororhynchos]